MMSNQLKADAGKYWEQHQKGGALEVQHFLKDSRRNVQNAMLAAFVRDQISSILGEVQGDYNMMGRGDPRAMEGQEDEDDGDGDEL